MKNLLLAIFLSISSVVAKVSVVTYNLHNFSNADGVVSKTNLTSLKKSLKTLDAHIFAFQEIKNGQLFLKFFKDAFPGYDLIISKCGGGGSQKLAVAYKKSHYQMVRYTEDQRFSFSRHCNRGSRPALIVELKENNHPEASFSIINLHLKAGATPAAITKRFKQIKLLETLISELRSRQKNRLIILGDLNTTNYFLKNQYYQKFKSFTRDASLTELVPENLCSSYWKDYRRDDTFFQPSRLDHILISSELASEFHSITGENHSHCFVNNCLPATSSELGHSFQNISDHCPVSIHAN